MRTSKTAYAIAAASLAALFATSPAEAAPRHRGEARSLTVTKRPFTDSGNVVNRGTQSRYVYDTSLNTRSIIFGTAGSNYGRETLPQRFDLGF